ncbi:MAG: energy-dependent translational throttle protein EttA [Candidatus Glassbacteria bacterium RIFCSPLOWO2_12_FULL_58_11]|uniref:Energy-dependent translational throttle protein EttA n=1 Tax=Candidatus Glassbacteria bacterium RIFCSPLOWO2_12_FULL_58_11 TaxID=1817867 RepID=A0A1F5YQ56_9BACT|nr:MAG: energy-dependent translational throttle protein EttA [Candidatus Glassbacteria bacterium RIFCSPLOWO2_12_FULL_58_11]
MAEQFIFTMLRLNKYYGQKQVLKEINLSFYPGAKIGIVGENGSGKSTVLRIMAGRDEEFQGQAEITRGFRAGMLAQDPELVLDNTIRENLELAFSETMKMLREYEALTARMGEPMEDDEMQKALDRLGVLQEKLDAADAWNLDTKLNQAAEALMLPEDERLVNTLSGGEKRRVALCKILLEQPDLLLLDEPTNHLDPETVDWLEAQLVDYPGTVIIVTHDRYFLDNITKWILELEGGHGIPWSGNYSSWIEQKLQKLLALEKKEAPRFKLLQRELAWIRMNNKDRHELSQNRLREYEKLAAREASGEGELIQIAPGPVLGDQVIDFSGVSKGFGENLLFKDLSFSVPRGAIVGLVGPNGAGKTTLLRLITGREKADSGEVKVGVSVRIGYAEQEREHLDKGRGLIDEIGEGASEIIIGKRSLPIRHYLSLFGFKGPDQQKKVGELSGGEMNRCQLAKVLKVGCNLLMLDEPTNDLDVNTLRMLEEAIQSFPGCALVISHDRFFLDRICTHLLVFEGEGQVRWFTGNFREYEEWRKKELGSGLFENRRSRYRKLVRK